jgi:SAM-dependent methyltransferase
MELARRILGALGKGVEIGGSSFSPFPGVRSFNLDLPSNAVFQRAQEALAGRTLPIDVFAAADRLPLATARLPFVLSSHVIEHLPDTIRALGEWDRVLRPGGIAFFVVPHRQRTFDRERPRTDLRHHLADYALRTTAATDPLVPTSHYHVWETADFVALIEHLVREHFLDWEIVEVEDVDSKAGNGFTVVAKKRASAPPLPQPTATRVAFHELTLALPFQVVGRSLEHIVPGPTLPPELDLSRGLYRAVPILEGFPPRAGKPFDLELGTPLPPPVLGNATWEGERLVFTGQYLTPTTWLEATFPDGSRQRVLPRHARGQLTVDLTGLHVPAEGFLVAAVNPPPGGGRGIDLAVAPRR